MTKSESRLVQFFVDHRDWMLDLWKVYDTHYERLIQRSFQLLKVPIEQMSEQNRLARDLLRRAFVDGDVTPYLDSLRSRGMLYAQAHVPFAEFYDVVSTHRRELVPVVFESYRAEPDRLAGAITVSAEFFDHVAGIITEHYLAEKERGRTEAPLEGANRFLDSIVESIPNMIFVKEARELRYVRFNRAGEELHGIKRTDLLGKDDFDVLPREQAEFFQARDRHTLAAKVVVDIAEEPVQTKYGVRWLHTKKVPLLDEDGEPKFLLGISEDITEWRRVNSELRQAKEAAEAASRELEAFSYSVAHDLRAPLRSIDGFSRALVDDWGDKLDGKAKDYLTRISAGATRMGQLIDALLSLARVSRTELVCGNVNLSEVACEAIRQLRTGEPSRVVDFEVQGELLAQADPQLLRVLLDNLLGNAWKFTSKVQAARIEFGRDGHAGAWAYYVRDNGAGFDMAYAQRLFTPFQRLHGANEFPGTGIGLATVERIVQRHGGRIWAEGAVNRGATFHFTLAAALEVDA